MRLAGGSAPSFPMLIKCSEAGQVLWMSPTARAALGEARSLADTVVSASGKPLGQPSGHARGICLSLISGAADGLLLSAHLLGEEEELREESGPRGLEGDDLRRFSRLEQTARKLVAIALPEVARLAEDAAIGTLWLADAPPGIDPMPLAGSLAGRTSRIGIGI